MSAATPFRRRLAAARRRLTGAAVLRGALVTLAVVGAVGAVALGAEAGLWMGVGLRTLVFWTLVVLATGLLLWTVGVPLLRGIGVLPGLDEKSVARRAGQDFAGVGDRLTALLDLADGHASAAPSPLHAAALDALAAEVQGVPFERVRAFGPVRQAAPWAAVPVGLVTLAFVLAPDATGGAARRLMAPGTFFAPPAPFALAVAPGNTAVSRGEALAVRVVAQGRELPMTATMEIGRVGERALETVRLQRDASSGGASATAFAHTVEAVQADLRYRVTADGVQSAWFTARVENRPVVRGLRVVVAPPGYARRPARALPEGVGDATGLAGSTVRVRVGLGGTKAVRGWLRVAFDGRAPVRVPLRLSAETGEAAFRLVGPGVYSVHLQSAAGLQNADPAEYALGTLGDTPPQITLVEGADGALSAAARRMAFRVSDDFGFAGAQLVWRVVERVGGSTTGWRTAALPLRARPLDQETAVLWRLPGAREGDVVELYGRVRDNGPFGHAARTPTVTLRFPGLGDRLDSFAAERDTAAQTLDRLDETAREAAERSERLRDALRRDPDADWESRRQVGELLEAQSQMQQQAQQLQEQMQELTRQAQTDGTMDESTQRLMQQMQQVMQELDAPELREALQRLQEAMERLNVPEMLDASEQADQLEEQFQQRLERAMELMQRMEAAVEMQSIARRAEDLAERQERAARESERLQSERERDEAGEDAESGEEGDESESGEESGEPGERGETPAERSPEAERARQEAQQRRAAEDAAALQRQIEALQQRLDEMRGSPTAPADAAMQQMQQGGGLPQQMEQTADEIRRGQSQQAEQQQREAARRFRRMAQGMQQAAMQGSGQRQRVDAAALRRALEDVLTLSQRQEALAAETGRTPVGNPALVPLGRRQRDLSDGFGAVRDTLLRVGRSTPQLGAAVQTRAATADAELARALAALAERQAPQAVASQRMAMSHLNELALLLAEVLDNLQNESQQSGGGGGGGQQQMQQMGEAQQRLNGQIQQMLNESAGQRLSGEAGRRMRQMAEQQEALRRQLEGMLEGGAGAGMDAQQRSALQRLAEQMREAAAELRSGRADLRALPRQQQILERMLDAQRSMNQRGREERREGESARTAAPPPPSRAPQTTRPADRIRADLIRALDSGYSADYQDLIKRYFERLQQRFGD